MDEEPKKRMRVVLATVTLPRIVNITSPSDGKCTTCAIDTQPNKCEKNIVEPTKCSLCLQHCGATMIDEELQKLQKELEEMRRLVQKEKCEAEKLLNEKRVYLQRMLSMQQSAVEKLVQNNRKLREEIGGMRKQLESADAISEHSFSQDELTIDETKITPEMVRAIVLPKITDVRSYNIQSCTVELQKMTQEEINKALYGNQKMKSILKDWTPEDTEMEMPRRRKIHQLKRKRCTEKFRKTYYANKINKKQSTPPRFGNSEVNEETFADVCEQQMHVGDGYVQLS